MTNDLKTTVAGAVTGVALIVKAIGEYWGLDLTIPDESLDSIIGIGVILLGFFANRPEKTT